MPPANNPTFDIETQVREALREEISKLTKRLDNGHRWSGRERIRFLKCLDQLIETNNVLDRVTSVPAPLPAKNGTSSKKGS